ncbi:sigma 54-interacting transcriptional regulator [Geomicrobium sp. JSM 1781026]|uniref:sigma 54-interacting transcriptional regulator n=1 Tax=Geomicrobium sp. JSM 1781026 TaxID=3344580 RepID=UPI0035C00736
MKKALIVGAGRGGTALYHLLLQYEQMRVYAVADLKKDAPGIVLAKQQNIQTGTDAIALYEDVKPDVIFEATGDTKALRSLQNHVRHTAAIVPAHVCNLLYQMLTEKDANQRLHRAILQSTHDGMIAIDEAGMTTVFNPSAEAMTGLSARHMLGRPLVQDMPSSRLPRVVETKQSEHHQKQQLENGQQIITTRVPLWDGQRCIGALSVFKDITEHVEITAEITNLKSVQRMLQAIIHSSDEAISVVDEQGTGFMINPAYTRLTGLKEEEVIGQPATKDIAEGESMHMKALRTRKPVRGTQMKVGNARRDVIVNVAPILVNGELKGSVGVLHDVSEIRELTVQLEEAKQRIRTLEAKYTFDDIVGQSAALMLAKEQAKVSANTPVDVLLRGESGTGKELFAHAIHNESNRKYEPFIRVNCAALAPSLLESELFGYEEGAFSGAKRGGKRGLFEEAHKGSIFLDEIGELPKPMQAKLLRVLQEKEIVRVGGTKSIPIDTRVIVATNVKLEEAMSDGDFRSDLFYRLNKMPIHIPSLRERREDIEPLSHHLLEKLNSEYGRFVQSITEQNQRSMQRYDWPGNVRELENVIARALIHLDYRSAVMNNVEIPSSLMQKPSSRTLQTSSKTGGTLDEQLGVYEKQLLADAMKENFGNKTQAAKALGISIRNLYYKLEKHQLAESDLQ